MSFLTTICKVIALTTLIIFSIGALCTSSCLRVKDLSLSQLTRTPHGPNPLSATSTSDVGDLHRGMLEPVVPDAMFEAPPYTPPKAGPYPPKPKWNGTLLPTPVLSSSSCPRDANYAMVCVAPLQKASSSKESWRLTNTSQR